MKTCYCAGAVRVGKNIFGFSGPIPADAFNLFNSPLSVVDRYAQFLAQNTPCEPTYLTHLAFGKTEKDARRKLESLNLGEYVRRISDYKLFNESFWDAQPKH